MCVCVCVCDPCVLMRVCVCVCVCACVCVLCVCVNVYVVCVCVCVCVCVVCVSVVCVCVCVCVLGTMLQVSVPFELSIANPAFGTKEVRTYVNSAHAESPNNVTLLLLGKRVPCLVCFRVNGASHSCPDAVYHQFMPAIRTCVCVRVCVCVCVRACACERERAITNQ